VTPFSRELQQGTELRYWNPAVAHRAATLNEEITRPSQNIAYVDDFQLILVLSVRVLPLVLLTRPPGVAALAKK
jgi:hypothetical protein